MNGKLAKDPIGMYGDIPIDPNEDLRNCSDKELMELYEKMIESDTKVDANPELEEEYETYGADRELRKMAIEKELKIRGKAGR